MSSAQSDSGLLIHRDVTSCDISQQQYPSPVAGAAYLSRGATGRWCEVLHIGPEQLAARVRQGVPVLTHDDAVQRIMAMPGHHSVDF